MSLGLRDLGFCGLAGSGFVYLRLNIAQKPSIVF